MISHSLSQQVSDLKRQLAEQKSECDAIRAECEEWKARASRESQEKAMLEELFKDSEKGKVEWWTKFKELQAVGSGAGLVRKRKRARNSEDDPENDEVDPDIVPASEASDDSLGGLSEAIRDDDEEPAQGAGVQTMNTAEALPTPPSDLIKAEEEEAHLTSEDPVRVKVEEQEDNEDKDIEYLSGTFPTTLGDIKIKVEPGMFSLPPDTVQARFRQANAQSLCIELDTEFHAQAVTRDFLSSKYGGNPNATWCSIAVKTRRQKGHDIPMYFCPNISWSPNLPRAPGLPGLYNTTRAGLEIEEIPMIVGLNVKNWVYMGHYVGVPQRPLSWEAIESLGEKALNAWVEDIIKKKWARKIRARVYLRLQGMEPTDEAVEQILNSQVLQQVSARDIRAAYERYDEIMHVVCLKPVRYDSDFQKEMVDGFRQYERETKTKHAVKKGGSTNQPRQRGKPSKKSNNSSKKVSSASAAPKAANTKARLNRGEQNDPVEVNEDGILVVITQAFQSARIYTIERNERARERFTDGESGKKSRGVTHMTRREVPSGHMDARTAHHPYRSDCSQHFAVPSRDLITPYFMGGGSSDLNNYDDISTRSEDSMVEIVQSTPQQPTANERYVLVYSKSKVYVHPTAFSRDNIPGFVAIVKKDTFLPTYLLSWIPESLLDQKGDKEWEKYYRVEAGASTTDDEDGVLIDPLPQRGESYAFSVPLTSIYSFMVTAPTFSSWYGSLTINMTNGSTLTTLHFHDDESPSMQFSRSSPNAPTWGGEALLQQLRTYCNLLKSNLQPHLYLVDPSKADIEAHTTILYEDLDFETSSSPVPVHLRPKSSRRASGGSNGGSNGGSRPPSMLHDSLSSPTNARMAILSGFSQLTRATRHAAQSVLSHPLAKPIIPHLPDPVRSLVNVQGEWTGWVEKGGVGEYESARVYLAKWARIVAEEGERARQREAHTVPGTTGDEEASDLGVFELLAESSNLQTPKPTRDPRHPIDKATWESWFDPSGKPTIEWLDFKKEVFRRGVSIDVKRKAWPFLLGVVPWTSNTAERDAIWEEKRKAYDALKSQWKGVDEVFNSPEMIEVRRNLERHRIDVDCRRTDRTHPLFALDETASGSSIAVSEDVGAHTQANKHVDTLSVILLTYHVYEKELGYVQGMSDLLSPLYVVCGGDEVESFWCFVAFMQRTKSNFLRDQSGMRRQLSTLQNLLSVMDPELYRHFEKAGALNLFFCYRWILILFKREFPFENVINLWECIWTDYYSTQFHLFVALAILESHRDVILRYLVEFDEVLKYCNDLSMTIELDSTLAQAEVLFLSFFQIVADIDRRRAETNDTVQLRRRKKTSGAGTSTSPTDELQTVSLPIVEDNLRELLVPGK